MDVDCIIINNCTLGRCLYLDEAPAGMNNLRNRR